MAKKAAPKKRAVSKTGDVVTGLAPAKRDVHEVEILPSKEAERAVALRAEAVKLTVTDQQTHTTALQTLRDVKSVKRAIAAHWKRMKDPLNNLLRHVRDLEAGELAPTDEAIALIEGKTVPYEREARRIADERAAVARQKAEDDAADARRRELENAEKQALALEAMTTDLSERESAFVDAIVLDGATPFNAATRAGYAKPTEQSDRLMRTAKITAAIEARRSAIALREQAAARAEEPVEAEPIEDIAPALGKVSGVRNTVFYSCGTANVAVMLEGWKAGIVPAEAFLANMPFLNKEAGRLKDAALFVHAYPGCTLSKKEGHAG